MVLSPLRSLVVHDVICNWAIALKKHARMNYEIAFVAPDEPWKEITKNMKGYTFRKIATQNKMKLISSAVFSGRST